MDNNMEWLHQTKIRYNPRTTSYHKILTPIVSPVKRLFRKAFKFIGDPMVNDINEYNHRLLLEMAADMAELQQLKQNHQELDQKYQGLDQKYQGLDQRYQELSDFTQRINDFAHLSSDTFNRFINAHTCYLDCGHKTVARVGPDVCAFFAVLDKNDNDPITLALRTGNIVGIESRLLEIFPHTNNNYFVDLGANIGSFSLFLGANGWRGCAVEASPHNVDLLQKSVALNDFNITVVNKAISDYTGSLYFRSNGPWGEVVKEPLPGCEELPCIALDDVLDTTFKNVEKIDLIKMDIEGSEPAALRGMKSFLAKYDFPPIFMEINALTLLSFRETPMSLLKLSQALGYCAYVFGDNGTLIPHSCDEFQTEVLIDVLLLKKIPENLSYKIADSRTLNHTEMVNFIADQLADIENWPFHQLYLLYVLKDFPAYYNDAKIYGHLKKGPIQKKLDEFPMYAHVAEWIKELS